MPNFSQTASAKTGFPVVSDVHVQEAYPLALAKGLVKCFKREFETPMQGLQFVRETPVDSDTGTFQTFRGIAGLVPYSRDTDKLQYISAADAFGFSYTTYVWRLAIAIERRLERIDSVGVTKGKQGELARAAKLTIEHAIADYHNRILGTSGAALLADDGMYPVDSARPNANPNVSNWSNLESTAVLGETALFAASLAARQMTGEDGELYPQKIQKIVIRPNEEKAMWVLLDSKQQIGGSLNDSNWAAGAFKMSDVIVYDYMTTQQILYMLADPKSDQNETYLFWLDRPQIETWKSSPDVTDQRVRMDFGLGLGNVRKFIRGGVLS
jgi:phage major head subunit gpT-like protein